MTPSEEPLDAEMSDRLDAAFGEEAPTDLEARVTAALDAAERRRIGFVVVRRAAVAAAVVLSVGASGYLLTATRRDSLGMSQARKDSPMPRQTSDMAALRSPEAESAAAEPAAAPPPERRAANGRFGDEKAQGQFSEVNEFKRGDASAPENETRFQPAGDAPRSTVGKNTVLKPGDQYRAAKDEQQTGKSQNEAQPGQGAGGAPAAAPVDLANAALAGRKIIRSGEMSITVDRFDTALQTVTKIAGEQGGFVSATQSAKQPDGRVSGTVTLRIPPEKLDETLLKLRGLGEQTHQHIGAQDVSKEYTDTESQLRAARAMEGRLLDLIKDGQGQIKDLLNVEKELAGWREKIETLEGQKRFYDNVVGLSTLVLTLTDRAAAGAINVITETRTVTAGVESEDVDAARASLLTSLSRTKARVTRSDLRKLDGEQIVATIIADVPGADVDAVTDAVRKLGRLARLDAGEKVVGANPQATQSQTTQSLTGEPLAASQVNPVLVTVTIYNLANVAARTTQALELAVSDVEATRIAIVANATKAGGRVIRSQFSRQGDDASTADIALETPAAAADEFLATIRGTALVRSITLQQNPDTANTTDAKRGFTIRLIALATVPPRQTTVTQLAVSDPEAAAQQLTAQAAGWGGRVIDQRGNAAGGEKSSWLLIDVPMAKRDLATAELKRLGDVRASSTVQNRAVADDANAAARFEITLAVPGAIVPAEDGFWASTRAGLATSVRGLALTAQWLVVGLLLVGPWMILATVAWKIGRRLFMRRAAV